MVCRFPKRQKVKLASKQKLETLLAELEKSATPAQKVLITQAREKAARLTRLWRVNAPKAEMFEEHKKHPNWVVRLANVTESDKTNPEFAAFIAPKRV